MLKVLLIDDERWILEDLHVIIEWEKLGYEIIGAVQNTKDARRITLKQKPDLIICDIKMPREDGITFLKRLRGEGVNTAFIFLTALSEFDCAREALKYNAQSYLLKPVDEEILTDELCKAKERILEQKRIEMAKKLLDDIPMERNKDSDIIAEVQKDILQNYNNKLQLASYASKYFVNANYLSQLFKQETGKSFTQYLLDVRLMKAEYLLKETDFTINEISGQVGYPDYGHFSKIFKKHRGVSPQNYRNELEK